MKTLNPYQIKWALVVLTEAPSKHKLRLLNNAIETGTASDRRNYFFFHNASEMLLDRRLSKIMPALSSIGAKAKIYIFTDMQYGMITNSYNGTIPECPAPFTHPVVLTDDSCISVVPLSESQFNNAIEI